MDVWRFDATNLTVAVLLLLTKIIKNHFCYTKNENELKMNITNKNVHNKITKI